MRDDDRVFIYGQDVGGSFGGAFKATKGLAKEFPGRVLNTPISEDAMVGTAIGAALEGMRPIVEMQFADFSSTALNQILNNAGTHYWRTNVPVPITVRLPSGGTKGSGPGLTPRDRLAIRVNDRRSESFLGVVVPQKPHPRHPRCDRRDLRLCSRHVSRWRAGGRRQQEQPE